MMRVYKFGIGQEVYCKHLEGKAKIVALWGAEFYNEICKLNGTKLDGWSQYFPGWQNGLVAVLEFERYTPLISFDTVVSRNPDSSYDVLTAIYENLPTQKAMATPYNTLISVEDYESRR